MVGLVIVALGSWAAAQEPILNELNELNDSNELNERQQPRPNMVVIFTDDQGWNDVSCYGSEIPTPHIDALAARGLRFDQFYAASSICTPSRFGLLTGQFPTRSRDQLLNALMFLSEEDADRGIQPGESTYVSLLSQAGYRTALIGKWHLGHGRLEYWPTRHGFDSFFGHTGGCVDFFTLHYGTKPDWYRDEQLLIDKVPAAGTYATDTILGESLEFLDAWAKEGDGAPPFYLHVSFNAPHFGKAGDFETGQITNRMQPRTHDLEQVPDSIVDPLRRAFAAKVIGMDAAIGQLMQKLSELNAMQNTLVVFMTDHGGDPDYGGANLPLRGGKATLFEGGLRVPCIAAWPGNIPMGRRTSAVTCAMDWFPTLCAVAGISEASQRERGARTDGTNLLPLFHGDAQTSVLESQLAERTLVWQTGNHDELERKSWLAVRRGNWKLVQPPDQPPMLFDLSQDPNESHNLAPARADILGDLQAAAQSMLQSHRSTGN